MGHKKYLIFLSCLLSKDQGSSGSSTSTCVSPLVLRQRAAVAEALVALSTLCRQLAQVHLVVQHQHGAHAEGLAALRALVGLVAGMVVLVHVEVGHSREVLAT